VALQRSVGINTEVLSSEGIRELLPRMETADLVAAAWEEESGYADPYLTVTAYARAAKSRGVDVMPDTEVTGIRMAGGQVLGVDTPKEGLDAPVVINTAGSWGAQVARMAGVEAPINACRVQVAFFKRPPGHEATHPVLGDFIHSFYVRPETGGLSLMGLIDPGEAKATVNPDNFDQKMDMEFLLDAGERLVRRYPAMDLAESTGGFASLYGITPDWHPIIDEAPAGSGFYTCAGFSGHGFKLGPAVSVMLADLVLAEPEPKFDASLFRLGRFAEGALVEGQYEYSIVG
jgi:sarcosine oxidase subunit beta